MRAAALLVALLALTASAQTPRFKRFTTRTDQGRNSRGLLANSLAFFEAFNGAGTTTACSTTAPTGANGETLTFTRTGNATCTKTASGGLATTGIADGDLVVMSGNQPRVEYDSAGVLGLLVESSRTNDALRSQEWNNAAWLSTSGGVALPTVTPDAATAPDGTTTAERLQVPATTSGQYSYVYQSGFSAVARVTSFYVKGNGTSGNINLISGSTPNACVSCAYVSTSWTRCTLPSTGTASTLFFVGNDSASAVCGTSSKSAVDVFVWGAQHEAGAYATSYIPTTTAAAARNAERAHFAQAFPAGAQSIASTRTGPNTTAVGASVWALTGNHASIGYGLGQYRSASSYFGLITGTTPVIGFTASPTGVDRAWMSADGTTIAGSFAGASNSTASATVPASVTALCVGVDCTNGAATGQADGIVSRVCLDPSPLRCR